MTYLPLELIAKSDVIHAVSGKRPTAEEIIRF
jgi:hypothetical protein